MASLSHFPNKFQVLLALIGLSLGNFGQDATGLRSLSHFLTLNLVDKVANLNK